MIIERYLVREIIATFVGVALLLALIFFGGTFVRILAEAADGNYPARLVLTLFALKGVGNLVFILPLAFFLAVLLALGRLYRDSEMVVLYACGVGPRRIYYSVALLAVPVAAALGLLALSFAPWAEEQSYRLLDKAGAAPAIEGIAAGRFNKAGAGGQLVYVEEIAGDRKTLRKVFAYGEAGGRKQLLSAEQAHEFNDPATGERYLVLQDGFRYEGLPGAPDFKVIEFKEHGLRLVERTVQPSARPRHAVSSMTLWQSADRGDGAELQWRMAVPLSTLLLGLLAVPLSRSSPREGRYGRLFGGIVVYLLYNNLLTMARSGMAKGDDVGMFGLWWVHGLILIILLLLTWQQQRLRGPRQGR